MPRFSQLSDWLAWLESSHPTEIDLGLARVYTVARKLNLLLDPSDISSSYSGTLAVDACVITIAGTNGKGSCVKTLEQCLLSQHHSVGAYTSPHLHHYCERIQVNGEPVSEQWVCDAFAAIDEARGDISLTYFEFGTLAALWIFVQQKIPYILLEVGLGGRLDAINIADADIAVVTSIDVDHEEWLGSDREVIATEKLGVARKGRPVVITEAKLTRSLNQFIENHSQSYVLGRDFSFDGHMPTDESGHLADVADKWCWQSVNPKAAVLTDTRPLLPLPSVAAALQVLNLLGLLPDSQSLSALLPRIQLAGRFQILSYRQREIIFDVAHNPAAAIMLAERLASIENVAPPPVGVAVDAELADATLMGKKTSAVFAVMADKELPAIIEPVSIYFDNWYIGGLDMPRAATNTVVSDLLTRYGQVHQSESHVTQAFERALSESQEHDRIVVFGSFFTVAAVQHYIDENR